MSTQHSDDRLATATAVLFSAVSRAASDKEGSANRRLPRGTRPVVLMRSVCPMKNHILQYRYL